MLQLGARPEVFVEVESHAMVDVNTKSTDTQVASLEGSDTGSQFERRSEKTGEILANQV